MTILLIACMILTLSVFSMLSGLLILIFSRNYDKNALLADKLVMYGAISSMSTLLIGLIVFFIIEIVKSI